MSATEGQELEGRGLALEHALGSELVGLRTDDPDLSVIVRGDAKTKYAKFVGVMDMLQQANVVKVDLATEPYDGK